MNSKPRNRRTGFNSVPNSLQLTYNWFKPALTQLNSHKMIFLFRDRALEIRMRQGIVLRPSLAKPEKTLALRFPENILGMKQCKAHFAGTGSAKIQLIS
jgi:hypothetical protein